ncbi:MAG: arylsulfatase [Planctomycetota bacterium]|nr:MAG: arylsulfatase [Planctomycetota bacterium]
MVYRYCSLLFALMVVTVVVGCSTISKTCRPNIIYFLADDLGYGELGCYGQQKILTPHANHLAAEGMRFTQHYCGAPVCAPSRCVLMTGKHLGHAYIRNNKEVRPEGQIPIPAEEITIAELLKNSGYATAAIGKWGLGPVGSTGDPNRQGFDLFFGYHCQRHAHSYYPSYLWYNDRRITLNNNPPIPGHAPFPAGADPHDPAYYARFKGQDYTPARMIDQALTFIREHKDEPFFLYYPTPLPHLALHVPDEELEQYLGKWKETPFAGYGYTPHLTPRAAYAAMISYMDKNLGRIMALLKELGLDNNTLVIFSSDNGTTLVKEEVDTEFFNSVGPLRGLKGSVYEGGIRVPMIARWPGKIPPGATSDHVCTFYDVMPTLCEVAGIKPPKNIDGISFITTLLRQGRQEEHEYLVWEFYGYRGQQAVRMGNWKGVRRECYKNPDGPIELYDLAVDIGEKINVADRHPKIVKRIARIMRQEHSPSEIWDFHKTPTKSKPKR